jgi:hypothetical protein
MSAPKLFISYSWSTPDHEKWVLDLATELQQSGVEVIIDKWDLREGQDAIVFMEKMVTDPKINKVMIVSDKTYASKADDRTGGVGTETQIISYEVYGKASQEKFVLVVAERDPEGKPYIPTYFKTRIHIDLSESDKYTSNFDTLLRWIFNKPLHVKPPLGPPPSFLVESSAVTLGTSALAKRTLEAIKGDKSYAKGLLAEYLGTYSLNLNRFRISEKTGEFDDRIVEAIEAFLPYRNELIQVISTLVQYDSLDSSKALHRFIESLLPYYHRPDEQTSWDEREFDHFKYIVHELFLYTLAIYLRQEDYSSANYLLSTPYYLLKNTLRPQESAVSYTEIREHIDTLEHRNKRLNLRRLSLRADFLEKNSKPSGVPFRYVMQADFICFMRSELTKTDIYGGWWPETLIYANRSYAAFEIFARAASKTYLAKVLPLLGVTEISSIKDKLSSYATDRQSLPRWQHESFSPATLLGIEQLGTQV